MKWSEEKIKIGIMNLAKQFDPIRMPTNREVLEMTGNHALSMAIQKNGGYEAWANRLGLEQKYSETLIGVKWEKTVARILEGRGHRIEMTSIKYPYDILVDECIKIDVKVANKSKVNGSYIYAYRLAKPQQTCDFYVCCENDGANRIYVIPANAVNGQKQMDMGSITTKYDVYEDAWNLIAHAAAFYKDLIAM